MLTTEMRLHLNDECPAIGSGVRIVQVRRAAGSHNAKYVYLKAPSSERWTRMLIPVFDKIFLDPLNKAERLRLLAAWDADNWREIQTDSINREVRRLLAGVT